MTCGELRAVAADVALDELTGADRAAAIEHLARCDGCRVEVAELAAIADSVLLTAPELEPPAGFESRVIARFGAAGPPAGRAWTRGAAIAAAVFAVGALAGAVLAGGRDTSSLPAAAELRTADGTLAGAVVLADGPDRMTCVFEHPRFDGEYAVQLVLEGGGVRDAGTFTADSSPWSWTVPLRFDAADVREVRVLSPDGVVRATARV